MAVPSEGAHLISFRYHLVTIVAIFLALALGLLAGTTVINRVLVDTLRRQTDEAQHQASEAERTATELQKLIPFILADRLPTTSAVIVTYEGSDGAALGQTEASLQAAGADVLGVLPVTSRIVDPGAAKALAKILAVPANTPNAAMQEDLATQFAARLTSRARTAGGPGDLLGELISQGFIRKGDISPATLKEIGQRGQVVVALAGGTVKAGLKPQAFMVPLVKQLVGRVPVAAGQSTNTSDPFVSALRSDGSVDSGEIVTVDDLDRQIGGAALVLGLDQLLESPTDGGGSYGLSGDSLLPAPPAPSPTP